MITIKCNDCGRQHNATSMTMIFVCECGKQLIWEGKLTKNVLLLQKKRPQKRDVMPNGMTYPERSEFLRKKYCPQ